MSNILFKLLDTVKTAIDTDSYLQIPIQSLTHQLLLEQNVVLRRLSIDVNDMSYGEYKQTTTWMNKHGKVLYTINPIDQTQPYRQISFLFTKDCLLYVVNFSLNRDDHLVHDVHMFVINVTKETLVKITNSSIIIQSYLEEKQ